MPYGLINADVMQTSTTNGVLGAKNASTLQNRLINAGFAINQRGYVSGTALSAGTYAHDRFKAGASGCTYTFTQLSLGVPIVITITAGSLQQVIEGCNMPDGGTYVLSWTGTAQARFNGGTYGSSPLAVTGITAGANTTIEFNTGTLSYPQLEVGRSATGFEYRQYQQELALCQRYTFSAGLQYSTYVGGCNASNSALPTIPFPVTMRSIPTMTATGSFAGDNGIVIQTYTAGNVTLNNAGVNTARPYFTSGTGTAFTAGQAFSTNNSGTGTLLFSAEL
jgi:hypothetical protein